MDDGRGQEYPEARQSEAQLRDPALEGAPASVNLGFADAGINPDSEAAAATETAAAINAELAKVGIAGRVTARLVDRLIGKSGALVAGRYRTGRIAVSAQSGDPLGVTRHEIIHALRDRSLWGRGNGLFTDAEWEGLVREAKRHKDIRARVEVEYADGDGRTPIAQTCDEHLAWRLTKVSIRPCLEGRSTKFRSKVFSRGRTGGVGVRCARMAAN